MTTESRFCTAIKSLAENDFALENLELYLSHHFAEWLIKWASTPEGITEEFEAFASISFD